MHPKALGLEHDPMESEAGRGSGGARVRGKELLQLLWLGGGRKGAPRESPPLRRAAPYTCPPQIHPLPCSSGQPIPGQVRTARWTPSSEACLLS